MKVTTAHESTKVSLSLNFEVEEEEKDYNRNFNYSQKFSCKSSNGRQISGKLMLFQQFATSKEIENGITVHHAIRIQGVDLALENVRNLHSTFKYTFNDKIHSGDLIAQNHIRVDGNFYGLRTRTKSHIVCHDLRFKGISFQGQFDITFEETGKDFFRKKFNSLIMKEVFIPGKGEQVQLEAFDESDDKYRKIEVNKYLLASISDVFKTMLDGQNYNESKNNCVRIEDFDFEVICQFKNVVFGDTNVQVFDDSYFSVELLMFANKYNIKPLIKVCTERFVKEFEEGQFDNLENHDDLVKDLLAITKTTYLVENEMLFQLSAKAIHKNLALLKNSDEWKSLRANYPNCILEIMDSMITNA